MLTNHSLHWTSFTTLHSYVIKLPFEKKPPSCLRVNVSLQVSLRHKKALHADSFLEEKIAGTLGWHQTGETIENWYHIAIHDSLFYLKNTIHEWPYKTTSKGPVCVMQWSVMLKARALFYHTYHLSSYEDSYQGQSVLYDENSCTGKITYQNNLLTPWAKIVVREWPFF